MSWWVLQWLPALPELEQRKSSNCCRRFSAAAQIGFYKFGPWTHHVASCQLKTFCFPWTRCAAAPRALLSLQQIRCCYCAVAALVAFVGRQQSGGDALSSWFHGPQSHFFGSLKHDQLGVKCFDSPRSSHFHGLNISTPTSWHHLRSHTLVIKCHTRRINTVCLTIYTIEHVCSSTTPCSYHKLALPAMALTTCKPSTVEHTSSILDYAENISWNSLHYSLKCIISLGNFSTIRFLSPGLGTKSPLKKGWSFC